MLAMRQLFRGLNSVRQLQGVTRRYLAQTKQTKTFEQLLEENTDESLEQAAKLLVKLENEEKHHKHHEDELKQRISEYTKHIDPFKIKLETLRTNIKNQEEELELVKKRTEKEVENAKDYAITKFAKDIIEVSDNLKKSTELAKKRYEGKSDPYLESLIQHKDELFSILKKHDIEEFDPTGQKYDPNTQESMVEVPDPSKPSGTVAMTTVTGYKIKDRLLRSAKVCVYKS